MDGVECRWSVCWEDGAGPSPPTSARSLGGDADADAVGVGEEVPVGKLTRSLMRTPPIAECDLPTMHRPPLRRAPQPPFQAAAVQHAEGRPHQYQHQHHTTGFYSLREDPDMEPAPVTDEGGHAEGTMFRRIDRTNSQVKFTTQGDSAIEVAMRRELTKLVATAPPDERPVRATAPFAFAKPNYM